jgi:hypothetical protein
MSKLWNKFSQQQKTFLVILVVVTLFWLGGWYNDHYHYTMSLKDQRKAELIKQAIDHLQQMEDADRSHR